MSWMMALLVVLRLASVVSQWFVLSRLSYICAVSAMYGLRYVWVGGGGKLPAITESRYTH